MYLKYVVDEHDHFLLFDPNIRHDTASKGLTGKIVGAGFAFLTTEADGIAVICRGESTTLGITSRKEVDAAIISSWTKQSTY